MSGPSSGKDPFWNTVESFGIDQVMVLPEWMAEMRGSGAAGQGTGSPGSVSEDLELLRERVGNCTACRLAETRNCLVFGAGNPAAGILFVGEGPGADEDATGEPFVGRAGKLLDRIMASIDLDRTNSYIANIVKCRPPGNRNPSREESTACRWILEEQIEIMKPSVIVALGASAARALTGSREGIGKIRGSPQHYGDIPLIATYHPAALLRTQALKRPVWEDMKALRALMDELGLPRTERDPK